MARITNQKLSNDIAYLKGKVDSESEHSKQHREWEVEQMKDIKDYLKDQNGRIRKNEVTIGWFKGMAVMFSGIIGWIFKRTI